jgi:hypothetical protein
MSLHDERYRRLIERLVQARRRLGLSQSAVAQQLVLDPQRPGKRPPQSFVSKCETRERRLDAVELSVFARLYGMSVDDLLADGESDLLAGAALAREGSVSAGAAVSADRPPVENAGRPAPSRSPASRARRARRRS